MIANKIPYIVVNILVSALGFARNLIFLKAFGFADLGQIALMQTIIMLVGMLQLGFVNGAYRIYTIGKSEQNSRINDTLFTFFLLLTFSILATGFSLSSSSHADFIHPETLIIGLIAGVISVVSNWINNALIGDGKLLRSNYINLVAAFLSLGAAIISFEFGLSVALLSMLVQPACVVVFGLFLQKNLRPKRVNLDIGIVKQIFGFGFIPYLAGIFTLLSYQVERWSITYVLGAEALGQFYIVLLYGSVFLLIPVSLLNLYFPKAIRAYEGAQFEVFRHLIKRHFLELFLYLVLMLVGTSLVLPLVVRHYFPKYSDSLYLINYIIPGLVCIVLCDPASLFFNSTKRLRPLLISGSLVLLLGLVLIYVAYMMKIFTLEIAAIIRSITGIVAFAYLLFQMVVSYKKLYSS